MEVTSEQQYLLDKHLQLVLQANKIHNLTRIKDPDTAKILHIEDSLSSVPIINKQKEGKLLDIGSGAGYPGIPLAICTNRDVTLCETVTKKAKCLENFINELNLSKNINVFNGRAEEIQNKYQIITARAVSQLGSLLELSSPNLNIGGILIAYKNTNCDDKYNPDIFGMKLKEVINYKLSNETKHSLIVFIKVKEPEIKLPRKLGFAQKKPIYK